MSKPREEQHSLQPTLAESQRFQDAAAFYAQIITFSSSYLAFQLGQSAHDDLLHLIGPSFLCFALQSHFFELECALSALFPVSDIVFPESVCL